MTTRVQSVQLASYAALMIATVRALTTRWGTWAALPTCILIAAYIASTCRIVAAVQQRHDASDVASDVAHVLYMSYFAVRVLWPFPMAWYDAMAALALMLDRGTGMWVALMAVYYVGSATGYAARSDILQVVGRTGLLWATASTVI